MLRRYRAALAAGVALGLVAVSAAGPASAGAAATDEIRDGQQWVLNMLDVSSAWQQTEGAGVTVAVLDSGVNPDVSDLAGAVITGPDLTGLRTPVSNPDWGVHGTWMASIIAGHGHDDGQDGVVGIAPAARILSIRVIPEKDDPGYRQYGTEREGRIQQALATGIQDAVKRGAQVISMSLGYTAPSAGVRAAVQYALDHGVVLVASSGNSGQDDVHSDDGFAPVSFPADYPGVLSVAALNSDGTVAKFSSNNLSVQVAAPGDDVPAQGRDGQYWLVSGTSPACALVAGVAALIKSKYRGLAPHLVLQAITSTARSGQYGGYNPRTGFGAVDAGAALRAAGRLAGARPAKSPVPATAKFGASAALPAEPVPPRGSGELALFAALAFASLVLAAAGGAGLIAARRRRRRYYSEAGRHAVTLPGYPRYGYGEYGQRGYDAGD
ncbi:MAG TPA: S8 family serine peptidase [Trebonia sp.]|jgi:type VII secretion-associated serine protease mycosin|nr:S8 family serine peptidase [Trebonia sp.]